MVMAKLHLICGNCGCNNSFKYKVNQYPSDDEEGVEVISVTIICENCSTCHVLDDNAEIEN